MSEFEFMRFVTIGQYLPTGSRIHRLDPRARLVGGLLLVSAFTLARRPTGLLAGMLLLLPLLVFSRISLRFALRGLLPPLPLIFFLAFLQIIFGSQPDARILLAIGSWQLSIEDLLAALNLILRFAALLLSISWLSCVLSTTELVHALEALLRPFTRLGLPTHDFVLMVQVALRFTPLLAREAERIAKAQASRGADWAGRGGGLLLRARRVLPLVAPLFLTGLQRAENLALAMEARGYSGGRGRTSFVVLHFTWPDALSILVVLNMAALIVWL